MTQPSKGIQEIIKKYQCRDCGLWFKYGEMHQVYEFGDEDGKPCKICDDCYSKHDEKGDWCS